MKNKNMPSDYELPSIGKLVKSTILAICIAAVILVTVVLPAEYGLDPTGIGSFLGLSKMGVIKVSLAEEAAADRAIPSAEEPDSIDDTKLPSGSVAKEVPTPSSSNAQTDEVTLSLLPGEGKEIKLVMNKGEQVDYVWWTDGGRANFDAHADSKILEIKYHNYAKGSEERSEGVLEAAFDGKHGWFWRNRTSAPMTVTLQVAGEYSDIVQMQ